MGDRGTCPHQYIDPLQRHGMGCPACLGERIADLEAENNELRKLSEENQRLREINERLEDELGYTKVLKEDDDG